MKEIKELSNRQLIINALHSYQINAIYHDRTLSPRSLSLEQKSERYFWGYLSSIIDILEKSKRLKSYTTKDTLQNVIFNDNIDIIRKGNELCIDEKVNMDEVNWHLSDSHKREIYEACEIAYKQMILNNLKKGFVIS